MSKCIGSGRCPRKLTSYPKTPCSEALKAIEGARNGVEQGCPWFVNDPSARYCFFAYMRDNAGSETQDHRIAQLLLIPDEEVKRVIANFKRRSTTVKALDE